MANRVFHGSLLPNRYFYTGYHDQIYIQIGIEGTEARLNNAYYIRDVLLRTSVPYKWRPNQITAIVVCAQWFGQLNPLWGYSYVASSLARGGLWNQFLPDIITAYCAGYKTRFERESMDAELKMLMADAEFNRVFDYRGVIGDAYQDFHSWLGSAQPLDFVTYWFYHGYLYAGATQPLIGIAQLDQQARYWYRILFNGTEGNPDGEGNPDLDPTYDPAIEEKAKRDFSLDNIVIPFTAGGGRGTSGRSGKSYLRGDCT